MPAGYVDETWTWLKVSDSTLDDYDIWVKREIESADSTTFEDFIKALLTPIDRWIFAFILHYDQIDHVYQVDVDQLTEKFRANLKRGNVEEGFIAYR